MIDLHLHSVCSDGTDTPAALVAKAVDGGLTAVALTDHDTVAGVPPFLAAAARAGLTGVSGVEVSATSAYGEMHLLGYFMDPVHAELTAMLSSIRSSRAVRNAAIRERLAELGVPLSEQEILDQAGEGVVGRPHFARAMVTRGYVPDTGTAFQRFLANHAPAYVPRKIMPASEIIAVIGRAGGLVALAHPSTCEEDGQPLDRLVRELKEQGLAGLEVYHSRHGPRHIQQYGELADALDLVPTGGSDYHGAATPDLQPGRGFGSLRVPLDTVDRLRARVGV